METAATVRSFHGAAGIISHAYSAFKKPGQAAWPSILGLPSAGQAGISVSCSKTPEGAMSKSNVPLSNGANGSTQKHGLRSATFPDAFEALLLEVCDETSIAELQLKASFEMHLKRNVGAKNAQPVVQAAPAPAPAPAGPSTSTSIPEPSSALASKLAALEASGTDGYKLVTSPTVGSFRKGRTVKGKKQPPVCKQGDIIKEGQIIGYVDQFGTELAVKSDVAGEILKFLFEEGEPVGYGEPIIAVLPSFHELDL
ncbi:hypothetical protein Cgig2_025414 [Carnegiea gigantea]|uniref:Lipoyl-binding domain-containing protein n=1 Tax=Carnegiea gigantea TaxID=171969 RepID=A0A9Q1QAG4_9CARY|nr:hypothetical protein Cgig2_025414 [Carnegiea gigantea]